ncbi:putative nicotinamide mononucleotide transporter [Vibrio phage KIT04]|nr:putative nicotinamide mononucleotide transporter [Vibrio phage KIT04]
MDLFQKIWAALAVLLVAGACVISGADLFVSALSLVGILFVLGVSYKKPESQLLGAVFCGFLAIASGGAGFYANAFVNGAILIPATIYGYILWKRRKGAGNLERSLTKNQFMQMSTAIAAATIITFFFTIGAGGAMPLLDAFTAVLPVAATLLMIGAYRDQWLLWIPYNAIQAFMWFTAASLQPAVLAVFVVKLVFLINSLIGYYYWRKGA